MGLKIFSQGKGQYIGFAKLSTHGRIKVNEKHLS
jgi:hypothetical protein